MTRRMMLSPIILVLAFYACTVPLNGILRENLAWQAKEADVIQKVFGGMRGFVALWAYMKAEEYYHRGLPFAQAAAYHGGESSFAAERPGAIGHTHGHGHEERGAGVAGAGSTLFEKIRSAVKVTGDVHLNPSEEKEVLPWFYMEVAFDPNDIRGYTMGGYWLERLGKQDEALKFFEEGLKNNPRSAGILASIGELYFHRARYDDAAAYLERSRALWIEAKPPNAVSDKYADSDRLFTFDLLGSIYEKNGDYKKALEVYKEIDKIDPVPAIAAKIGELEKKVGAA